jgi:hypothetical protein
MQPKRRLPTVLEVRRDYHLMGTEPPQISNLRELEHFNTLFHRSVGRPAIKAYYNGWIQYELGLAKHDNQPQIARQHYLKAITNMPKSIEPDTGASKQLQISHHLATTTLLWARLDENEREHGLQARATVTRLGELVCIAAAKARELPKAKYTEEGKERAHTWGYMAEIAAAGVLLTLKDEHGMGLWLPAPASPRQNSPHNSTIKDHAVTAIGQTAHAFDFNLLGYKGADATPSLIIPTQVKASNHHGEDSVYHSSIMMLYGDEDLYASDLKEWQQLGEELKVWRSNGPGRALELAQSNTSYAIERYLAAE